MNRPTLWCLTAAVLGLLPAPCRAQTPPAYTITTVAGNGTADYSGDGSQASAAEINFPMGVALDRSGNLYIADQFNARIRKVAVNGTISTVAGKGTSAYSGDGSSATSAELYNPCGVAVDAAGNLFIADTRNNRIRKVSTGGTITTVAGTGESGYSGDGGAATSATFNLPIALALDAAGNLYVADAYNSVVRKIATSGTITTVAGDGNAGDYGDGAAATSARLNHPGGVAVDAAGNLYITDTGNHRVRKVAPDGTIATLAGNRYRGFAGDGGPATEASLSYPEGIAVDVSGTVYFSDSSNSRIRAVMPNGVISTIAGNGKFGYSGDEGAATRAQLNFPHGLALDEAGRIYIADNQNSRIRLLTALPPQPADPAPLISASGVIGATAFGAFGSIAPGSWIEIYGSNLAAGSRPWAAADFKGGKAPTSLDGTSVSIGGQPAFVAYISPHQVNALVPSTVGTGTQQITVTTAGGTSEPYQIAVQAVQPGLLASPSFNIAGRQYVAAVFADGLTFALPAGTVPDAVSRPARPGETIMLYGSGFGPVTPRFEAGELVQQANALDLPLQILFGPAAAEVTYAGLAPGGVGLYQFNVVVPNVAGSDAVPLTFTLGGTTGAQTLYIAVGN